MAVDEIKGTIETIRSKKGKTLSSAYEKSRKLRQSIEKQSEKLIEGSNKLIEETEPKLTEEGVKKIKYRSQFRSVKAINSLVHFIEDNFSELVIPDPSKKLSNSELNQFTRVISRLINDTNRERTITDSIMGIDFALKKRTVYSPLSKLASDLNKLRDLQKEEYKSVKALEDLENLSIDITNILNKVSDAEEALNQLQQEFKMSEKSKEETEIEITLLMKDPLLQNSKKRGIRMTELEIEMGKHLNSFKKIFKKYSREIQRGSLSGEFGLVATAQGYIENPVQRFLEEEEGNFEIISLLEELIKVGESNLHLKQKNINNIRHELNNLKQGKLDIWKKEWKKHLKEKEENKTSSEFKTISNKLNQTEEKLLSIKEKISLKEEELSLKKKEISQLSESLRERRQRARDLAAEVLENS
ncbi:MAG: hypothetical protein ACXACR_16845, partial [Candidatus Hodarchaeales archaeon]